MIIEYVLHERELQYLFGVLHVFHRPTPSTTSTVFQAMSCSHGGGGNTVVRTRARSPATAISMTARGTSVSPFARGLTAPPDRPQPRDIWRGVVSADV